MHTDHRLKKEDIVLLLLIILAVLTIFHQTTSYPFCTFDDNFNVTDNSNVSSGLSVKNVLWALKFSSRGDLHYWHPLTSITHMIDCHLYKLKPAGHHASNILLHIFNTLLLYFFLMKTTGARWKSAFVSALFALHPLTAETVVWISERKNLLSTLFFLLSMIAYSNYAKTKTTSNYLLVFLFMLLGLLSKPILVILPCVFFLMDIWPLRRVSVITISTETGHNKQNGAWLKCLKNFNHIYFLFIEKIPLFALSLFWSYIASLSMKRIGASIPLEAVPMSLRAANAIVSYSKYLLKMLWPFDLGIYYPFPQTMPPLWQIFFSGLFVLFISFLAVTSINKRPWITVGWFWYLGTLFPAIGIMQNGLWPELADRWTYIPSIGIYIIIVWELNKLRYTFSTNKQIFNFAYIVFIVLFATLTYNQCYYWRDNISLFQRTAEVTTNNYVALENSAAALIAQNKPDEALKYLKKSIEIRPDNIIALNMLGDLYYNRAEYEKALVQYKKIIEIVPKSSKTYVSLGSIAYKKGEQTQSLNYYRKAIKFDPRNYNAYHDIGVIFSSQGDIKRAILYFRMAIALRSDLPEFHNSIGSAYEKNNDLNHAITHFQKALSLKHDYVDAHNNLGSALLKKKKIHQAFLHFSKAFEIEKENSKTLYNMGMALYELGNLQEAIKYYDDSIRLDPNFAEAYNNLGIIKYKEGNIIKAVELFKKAIEIMPDNKNFMQNYNVVVSKVEDAISTIKKQLQNDHKNSLLYYQLGKMYYIIGDEQKAIDQYKMALAIRPDFIQAKNALETILK
jgi:protein O-mannosyl-transferase